MHILNKKGDEIYILLRPEETLRIGECLNIGGITVQVIDIEYATLPGILEHILRKSLLGEPDIREESPEVKNILDTVADHRLAITKIRGTIGDGGYQHGLTEFSVARSNTPILKIQPEELLRLLGIDSPFAADFGTLLTNPPTGFKLLLDRLGINLITGMKEYLNLWRDESGRPGDYANYIKVLNPRAIRATANELPFRIPLEEVNYDEFAEFTNIDKASQMYNELIVFWGSQRGSFDLSDFEGYVSGIQNEYVRRGLEGKIRAAKALNLFGPSDIAGLISSLQETGGAIILNLTGVTRREREVLVKFVMRRLSQMGRENRIKPLSLFVEEAQLYISRDLVDDLLTRMRHYGIFPTFITNDPRTLPSEVFSLCDNLISFRFHNPDDLEQIAKAKMIDVETLGLLRQIQDRQCIVIGDVTKNFPLLMEVEPEPEVMMGGETKRLFS